MRKAYISARHLDVVSRSPSRPLRLPPPLAPLPPLAALQPARQVGGRQLLEPKVDAHLYVYADMYHGVHTAMQLNLHMQQPKAMADVHPLDDSYDFSRALT